jgi:hypothetical protein
MKELIEKYHSLQGEINEVYRQLENTSDGFLYLTKLRCYGSITWRTHKNSFLVQNLCNEYYGDNGIVDVYTTNPNHEISSYGEVVFMTESEIKEMSKESISMGEAITNWLTKTI